MQSLPINPHEQFKQQVAEFRAFEQGEIAGLRIAALSGHLKKTTTRSLSWRVFLGALPESVAEWPAHLSKTREQYDDHVTKLWVDPHSESSDDPTVNNPLSQVEGSVWHTFFKNRELQQQIEKDITRLYAEIPFFHTPEIRSILLRVLFIWSCLHKSTSYRQGMHELLGPIVWLASRESVDHMTILEASKYPVLEVALDYRYVEHDAFTLFSKLMERMGDLYEHVTPASQPTPPDQLPPVTPILRKCSRVYVLLKNRDPDVYRQLTALEIEPQLFMIRWLRCLFTREFHLEDVMILWDGIFGDDGNGQSFDLMDYLCLAMLKFIRSDLLRGDQSFCLRRLMRFPPVEDVHTFVEHALRLRSPQGTLPVPPQAVNVVARDLSPHSPKRFGIRNIKFPNAPFRKTSAKPEDAEEGPESSDDTIHPHAGRLSKKLNNLIDVLERNATVGNFSQTQTFVAIAHLKQVKDILRGAIPIENLDLLEQFDADDETNGNDEVDVSPNPSPWVDNSGSETPRAEETSRIEVAVNTVPVLKVPPIASPPPLEDDSVFVESAQHIITPKGSPRKVKDREEVVEGMEMRSQPSPRRSDDLIDAFSKDVSVPPKTDSQKKKVNLEDFGLLDLFKPSTASGTFHADSGLWGSTSAKKEKEKDKDKAGDLFSDSAIADDLFGKKANGQVKRGGLFDEEPSVSDELFRK